MATWLLAQGQRKKLLFLPGSLLHETAYISVVCHSRRICCVTQQTCQALVQHIRDLHYANLWFVSQEGGLACPLPACDTKPRYCAAGGPPPLLRHKTTFLFVKNTGLDTRLVFTAGSRHLPHARCSDLDRPKLYNTINRLGWVRTQR